MVTCNNCGTEMQDLVISDKWYRECRINLAYEPNPEELNYWLYICPNCGNVQAHRAEEE